LSTSSYLKTTIYKIKQGGIMATKKRIGRPKIEINWTEFDKLLGFQCTLAEIASWFNCNIKTIERRVKQDKGVTFIEYATYKRGAGLISLRRTLWRLSEKSAVVAMFLAKNYLGMSDRTEVVLDHAHVSTLTDAELEALIYPDDD